MKIPLVDLKAQYLKIKPEIDEAIQEILDNSTFIMGTPVKDFENNLSKFCGCKYSVGVSSGSSALFLALKAYGIREGDEVVTVPNSFIATAEAIVQVGARPIFVDVDEETMLMDAKELEEKITSKTKAIIPVHLYGQACEMDEIIRISKKHNLIIIEDAAQAIASEYKKRKLPFFETAIFSFFPAKNLGCYGDGGGIITNNEEIARRVYKLRDHGRISKYESDIIGYGERLDSLQSKILDVKLKYLDEWTEKRRKNAKIYSSFFEKINSIRIPYENKNSRHVYYQYVIRIKKRDELKSFLNERGICTGIHYPLPLHLQPSLKFLGYKKGDFPVAEKISEEILSLPIFPELTEEKIRYVCETIEEFYKA